MDIDLINDADVIDEELPGELGTEEGVQIPEYPMYEVVDASPTEIFSFYTMLILSVLIMHPVYRAIRGAVKAWK